MSIGLSDDSFITTQFVSIFEVLFSQGTAATEWMSGDHCYIRSLRNLIVCFMTVKKFANRKVDRVNATFSSALFLSRHGVEFATEKTPLTHWSLPLRSAPPPLESRSVWRFSRDRPAATLSRVCVGWFPCVFRDWLTSTRPSSSPNPTKHSDDDQVHNNIRWQERILGDDRGD